MPSRELHANAVTHGGILPIRHPELGVEIAGETAIRYLRFGRTVRLDRLELPRSVYGRWVPSVPTHPAHLLLSVLEEESNCWRTIREIDVPEDPRITGEGLTQEMPVEEMEAHFARVLEEPPFVIELEGLQTDHLRVECDREHPVWPSHGEVNGGPYHVPFGILHPLKAYGEPLDGEAWSAQYQPILNRGSIHPGAPDGMRLQIYPHMLLFAGEHFSVGFSLRRPVLLHLGWDAFGGDMARCNRHLVSARSGHTSLGAMSGPLLRTLQGDYFTRQWTGQVFAQDNRVIYHGLQCNDDVRYDVTFTVESDQLHMDVMQFCYRDLPVLETEIWRFCWDLCAGMTAVASEPMMLPGRNGRVALPARWATDGAGSLLLRQTRGKEVYLQVESYRELNCAAGGPVLANLPAPESCLLLPAGVRNASLELAFTELVPKRVPDAPPLSDGLRRHWGSVFACFRAEHRGFSNNAASTNCHLSQLPPIELAAHTAPADGAPDPLALGRYTIGRALLDGGGYGYHRNLYLDSDPVLLSAAGRLHQVQPETDWLARIAPGVSAATERMLATIGPEGLAICRHLSGNAGSFRWSSNGMDVVGFGHIDAYVNALCYRAFRNAVALLADAGLPELAARCRTAATGIRAAYAEYLLNPATGWVAGWRSRDEELHDYAFTWVNGMAVAFGLLEEEDACRALSNLEALREKLGISAAHFGLPLNLLPIRENDHMLPRIQGMPTPTFETYTDGSLCAQAATYYLRALSSYGFRERAHLLADELDAGYAAGFHTGGIGSGVEFRSWEGLPNGYEGTLIGCLGPLYAIAIEYGQFTPTDPEWWPADKG